MKSILDPSFVYTPSVNTDIRKTFERVWRQLGEREELHADADAEHDSVWLECDGDLVDASSVRTLGVRKSAPGIEVLQFLCPHCHEPHESLRFR